jgi:hypothetical protein
VTKNSAKNSFELWLEEHPEGITKVELERWYKEQEGKAKAEFERYLKEHPQKPDRMAFYFHRAESLLSGRAKITMTPEIRDMLERHLALCRKIATKLGPLNTETGELFVLVEIVSALKPRLNILLNRATGRGRAAIATNVARHDELIIDTWQATETDIFNLNLVNDKLPKKEKFLEKRFRRQVVRLRADGKLPPNSSKKKNTPF